MTVDGFSILQEALKVQKVWHHPLYIRHRRGSGELKPWPSNAALFMFV